MDNIRIEDIVFWILIIAIIATALWLLSGSPPESDALISLTISIAVSELLLWKALFKIDKRTLVGFIKVGNDLNIKYSEIKNELNEIKYLIKKR